jgi:hypothetical protein
MTDQSSACLCGRTPDPGVRPAPEFGCRCLDEVMTTARDVEIGTYTAERAEALRRGEIPAQTYRSYQQFTDPMLSAAAAEARPRDPDTLRWMGYADQELTRLRTLLSLPTRPGYAQGRPQYQDGDR